MSDLLLDFFFDRVMPWLTMLFISLVVIAIPVLIFAYISANNSPTFELRKTEWTCTDSRQVSSTIYVQSGNVMTPITTYSDDCHQWAKK